MFFSVHTMDGDPDQLLAAKRQHMDPVVARLAPRHGAVASIVVHTERGLTVYNVWSSAQGAKAFSHEPEALQAQAASGLPAPSSFTSFDDVQVILY